MGNGIDFLESDEFEDKWVAGCEGDLMKWLTKKIHERDQQMRKEGFEAARCNKGYDVYIDLEHFEQYKEIEKMSSNLT